MGYKKLWKVIDGDQTFYADNKNDAELVAMYTDGECKYAGRFTEENADKLIAQNRDFTFVHRDECSITTIDNITGCIFRIFCSEVSRFIPHAISIDIYNDSDICFNIKPTQEALDFLTEITYHSVELEANDFEDDTFVGTFDQCEQYCEKHGYTLGQDARIAIVQLDIDGCIQMVYDFIYDCQKAE